MVLFQNISENSTGNPLDDSGRTDPCEFDNHSEAGLVYNE